MSSSATQSPPIAVVGIAAQLPSGSFSDINLDYDAFIDFLLDKGEAYEPIPPTRFNVQHIKGSAIGQVLADTGAFLKDLDLFDHMEFGISSRDARAMPLSIRKLIETTFLSLCDSGIDYRGKNVGCYMSGVSHDIFAVSGHADADASGSFAYAPSMIANRVSFHLDLRGPSVPVDTACSSSLYATHLAVQALHNGECDAAVVGGCQINHRFVDWLSYTQGGILSPDGKCKPFDLTANGFGRGEGAVVITLKPLDAALRDHDHIYATILGTGVNSSGSLVPANAPAAAAQRDAMRRAFRMAARAPKDVDFLELHATGTAQGDPTEANWVGAEFQRDDELVLGSVKGNIGHLEITAFLASFCKVCGTLERRVIPPNVNFHTPNHMIGWNEYRLRVPVEPEPLRARAPNGIPLIAMTSSGIGGANGHAVIEGAPAPLAPKAFWRSGAAKSVPALLVAGGLSPRSATAVGEALAHAIAELGEDVSMAPGLAQTFGRRARSMTWRAFAVADRDGSASKAGVTLSFSKPVLAPKTRPPIVFVFSGQGTQHYQMGRQLFAACTPFRESILALDKVYASAVGTSLIASTGLFTDALADPKDTLGDPWPIAVTLPALTMLQLALVDALAAAGVAPDVVVGHSAGETAVLAASGSGSPAMALELAIARGRALALVEPAGGAMAAVSCSPEVAREIIEEVRTDLGEGALTVGCYNTASAVTLSGMGSHIDAAVAKAAARGIFARRLRTRIPVHSSMMELCRAEYNRLVAEVFARYPVSAPSVATYSATTGRVLASPFDAQYFWDGTIGPVLFDDALDALVADHESATFVEIGPHPVLSSYLLDRGTSPTLACPLRRPRAPEPGIEVREFVGALAKIVAAGHNCVDFDAIYGACAGAGGRKTAKGLAYPFAPRSLPWALPTADIARQRQHRNGPLNYRQLAVNVQTHPGLADHVIKGEPIMPASGFMEMALEFGASELFDVEFHGILPLSGDRPTAVRVDLDGTQWSVSSASSTDYTATWPIRYNRLHATGYLSTGPIQDRGYARLDLDALRGRMKPVEMIGFYEKLSSFANYGPMYQRIQRCFLAAGPRGAMEALVQVCGKRNDIPNFADYKLHPAIFDAAFHIIVHPCLTGNHDPNLYHLPSKLRAFRFCPGYFDWPFPETIYSHAKFVTWTPETLVYDFTVVDEAGTPLFVAEGLEVALHGYRMKPLEKRFDVTYRPTGISVPPLSLTSNGSARVHDAAYHLVSENAELEFETVVVPYVRGAEMDIQRTIMKLDTFQPLSLFLFAKAGVHGDAVQGFSRSLRKEYPIWTIRVAVFDGEWRAARREQASKALAAMETEELEMYVDKDGQVFAPRIEQVDPPNATVALDAGKPWKIEGGKVVQAPLHRPTDDEHVVVRVDRVGPRHGDLWTYVGNIDGTASSVVGVSSGPISSHLVVHKGSVAEVDPDAFRQDTGPPILAATLVALAVDPHAFSRPVYLRGARIVVVEDDAALRTQIRDVCAALGMDVLAVPAPLSREDMESCYEKKPQFVLSGTHDAAVAGALRTILAPRGRMLLWNHPGEGVAALTIDQPWIVEHALTLAVAHLRGKPERPVSSYVPTTSLLAGLPASVARSPDIFDPEKAYLLAGGIGSLGMHMALWMYEKGARNLVLTSRSGAATLGRRGDFIAERILVYLQGRTDLTLQTAAVDALSFEGMVSLVKGITRPLGGCVLLTATFVDGMFASHSQESFDSCFPAKIQAFQALENAVDLASLDFLITFSSVSGMFGNPGQTSYAAANSALAGVTRKYKNAFSIIAPAIWDSSILTLTDEAYHKSVRHMTKWGMTARDMCDYIGDGIMKLADGHRVWQYIPDFDWRAVQDNMGTSQLYDDLVPKNTVHAPADSPADERASIMQVVCRVLDLKEEDVSMDVPLTTYGLDSLTAAALSFALRPLLAVSQVQLLADLTIKDLQDRFDAVDGS